MAQIADAIRSFPDEIRNDSESATYLTAAGLLIHTFIHKDLRDEAFFGWEAVDGWLPSKFGNRVVLIGETLFLLHKSDCFLEFCTRMRERDNLQTAFYEALVARMFLYHGFEIVAIAESGALGEDFDFTARLMGRQLCVEVTSFQPEQLNEKTIANALKRKASQLPKDAASAVFCMCPEGWFDEPDAVPRLHRSARRFFGQSKRINTIVFFSEKNTELIASDGVPIGVAQTPMLRIDNPTPRTSTPLLAHLTFGGGKDLMESIDPANPDSIMNVVKRGREFFEWVDKLLAEKK